MVTAVGGELAGDRGSRRRFRLVLERLCDRRLLFLRHSCHRTFGRRHNVGLLEFEGKLTF